MKNPANSNIYEANALSVLEAYAGFVEATPEAMLLIVGEEAPSPAARDALTSSADRLGFKRSIAWLHLREAADAPTLGANDLFTITEGLDQVALIALDAASCTLFKEAYRCDVPLDTRTRIFGRTAATFQDFNAMLQEERTKQKAWSILKHLQKA